MTIPQDLNSLVSDIMAELDPGTLVILKLFDTPQDQNENPFAEDPFEQHHLSMASGGGNANYESHIPFVSQGNPFSV